MGHTEWAMWANEQGVITSVGEYVTILLKLRNFTSFSQSPPSGNEHSLHYETNLS